MTMENFIKLPILLELYTERDRKFLGYGLPAIYFLFNIDKKLVYIGQTANLKTRLALHKNNIFKRYNVYFFAYVYEDSKEKRGYLEQEYTNLLKPLHVCDTFNVDVAREAMDKKPII
jgi:hypothetical protein